MAMDRPPLTGVGRHWGFAMDMLTAIALFVIVAVVLAAGFYVMKPEK
jgi:hypothetical protein